MSMKILIAIFFLLFFTSCYDKYSKKYYHSTTLLKNGLFVESFTVYGSGASGTDMITDYLTDSLTFRMYAGTYDQGPEYYYYQINGDSILIQKYKSSSESKSKQKELIDKQLYFLSKLKQSNSYK